MRLPHVFVFSLGLLLAGCAVEGVIVEKSCRPIVDSSVPAMEGIHSFVFRGPTGTSRLPITATSQDYWSADRNAVCKFILRDRQGGLRSQLVTADVFARYRVGDYFNDLQNAVVQPDGKDSYNRGSNPVLRRSRASHAKHRTARHHRAHHKIVKHRKHSSRRVAQG